MTDQTQLPPFPSITAPLRLGEAVPGFTARSTQGQFSLADLRGRWVMLFSHPADFTPVCTSEFVAIARAADRFAALDCALVALSVDSLFSHLAWIRMIHDRFDVRIEFPIIEDPVDGHCPRLWDARTRCARRLRGSGELFRRS
ncbi:redoxin domain-containing protein [Sphingomonas oligophenolica]|uniref:redoxin domain-containing protein n=1 Tax=Sphingomonas oligophenolica TaxID=301154 RepID=UPI003CD0B609